jgi:hypothetical protein
MMYEILILKMLDAKDKITKLKDAAWSKYQQIYSN